jgi:thioredoxin reductase (NADPH)
VTSDNNAKTKKKTIMQQSSTENVIILGSGCAGLTAAIYAARANLSPLVLEGQLPGGLLTTTTEVENFPGFPQGVDGYELTNRMRQQAERFGARFSSDTIKSCDLQQGIKTLTGESRPYQTKTLIIATGASPRFLNIPGEKEMYGGKGVTTCATCDGAFYRGMDVCVVGGGDSACEEALFLTRFSPKVDLIHRRDQLRASKIMSDRVLAHPNIKPIWNAIPKAILPDETGHVRAISIENAQTQELQEVACKGVFVAIGHIPNTQIFVPALDCDEIGYLLPTLGSSVKTRVPGVFVAGDCSDHAYRQAITAAGMGCQAAIEAERFLA